MPRAYFRKAKGTSEISAVPNPYLAKDPRALISSSNISAPTDWALKLIRAEKKNNNELLATSLSPSALLSRPFADIAPAARTVG